MLVTEIDTKYVTRSENGFTYITADNPVFRIGGILPPSRNYGEYYRLDASKKTDYTDENNRLAEHLSGGTVRFRTDAQQISIRMTYRAASRDYRHFTDRGVFGIDIYTGEGTNRQYLGWPGQCWADNTESCQDIAWLDGKTHEIMVNLPLYGGLTMLEFGFREGDSIDIPSERSTKPVAFYGSSITQGGCASRPGTMYPNIVCRALDCDCIDLGFAGSAHGELYAADILAKRDISFFVMDYDYNADSPEELEKTHRPFYDRFRESHPDTPVLFMSHPVYVLEEEPDLIRRHEIVRTTYEYAKAKGDKVAFADGRTFFPKEMRDLNSVDCLHPSDLGMFRMAQTVLDSFKSLTK